MVGCMFLIWRVYFYMLVSFFLIRLYIDCLVIFIYVYGCDKGLIVEGDVMDSDGLEEFGRVFVLFVFIVIEERIDGLWLFWEEGGVVLDFFGGVWEDVGYGECEFLCR